MTGQQAIQWLRGQIPLGETRANSASEADELAFNALEKAVNQRDSLLLAMKQLVENDSN